MATNTRVARVIIKLDQIVASSTSSYHFVFRYPFSSYSRKLWEILDTMMASAIKTLSTK
eukprot:jgi/Bigna1/65845/fgenesh1_kg.136_\